ncbi:hypothetical protein BST25_20340 [Mycobacterium heidelbergense]|uniref:Uncharacterized protein n=1 Tax=Mycobacterium heidelbergense TaxID=53376 RepID=A0A1X0DC12_MYCHE|nr:hypothetical protein BST25_20340 [Mycobacterium heidelbergense]
MSATGSKSLSTPKTLSRAVDEDLPDATGFAGQTMHQGIPNEFIVHVVVFMSNIDTPLHNQDTLLEEAGPSVIWPILGRVLAGRCAPG